MMLCLSTNRVIVLDCFGVILALISMGRFADPDRRQ
jgi:hypothetical protein